MTIVESLKTLDNVVCKNKKVLLRVDFNVPFNEDGSIADDTRIVNTLITLKELQEKEAKIIVLSHLGRPSGKTVPELSLKPIAERLKILMNCNIYFASNCQGPAATTIINSLTSGEIALLENLRFYEEEENNDLNFARDLASFGDIFINDAFSMTHRDHASILGITNFLPSYAGRLFEKELSILTNLLKMPKTPLTTIIGGCKISTKLAILQNFPKFTDYLIITGGMSNIFLKTLGLNIGKSFCEPNMLPIAEKILKQTENQQCEIILPEDVVVAVECKENIETEIVSINDVKDHHIILDIGPRTVEKICRILQLSKTLFWNGPLGAFETPPFDRSTVKIALTIGNLTKKNSLTSIAGGGDTIGALQKIGCMDQFSYVSMAGGAFLKFIEGKKLASIEALKK